MGVRAVRAPERITTLIGDLSSRLPAVRYGAAKVLSQLAEAEPERVYPHFDFFAGLLDSEYTVLRWNAARILGFLAPADTQRKLDAMLDRYLAPIAGPEMIAAAHAMHGASHIALAKPGLADRLARAILRVGNATYKTPECRNIGIGHAIVALERFFQLIPEPAAILAFVSAQLENPRPATRKKAATFLKKHARSAARLRE